MNYSLMFARSILRKIMRKCCEGPKLDPADTGYCAISWKITLITWFVLLIFIY